MSSSPRKGYGAFQGRASRFYLNVQEQGLTRFANNVIHQNVSHSDAQLHIRATVGKRLGRAVTNDLSDSGLAKAVDQARQNATLMPEDPDFPGLPDPAEALSVNSYDESTASYSPEEPRGWGGNRLSPGPG